MLKDQGREGDVVSAGYDRPSSRQLDAPFQSPRSSAGQEKPHLATAEDRSARAAFDAVSARHACQ